MRCDQYETELERADGKLRYYFDQLELAKEQSKSDASLVSQLEKDKYELNRKVEELTSEALEKSEIAQKCYEELAELKMEGIKVSYEIANESNISSYV